MVKLCYSVAVDMAEVMTGSMDFHTILRETEARQTLLGSDEDPKLYVLYDTVEHRDAAYEAFKDRFRSSKRIYSPHQIEVEESGADE